jgi:deoxyadenosine/deoxycytidine kinase
MVSCYAVEGVIGVGKTTLAAAIATALGAARFFEAEIENPFLVDFYKQRERWALATQLCFLEGRIAQFGGAVNDGLPRVADHCLVKDLLFARLNLEGEQLALYERLFRRLSPLCRFRPEVVIYLKARLETLVERIRGRKRRVDADIPIDYLDRLIQAYDTCYLSAPPDDRAVVVVDLDAADISATPEAVVDLLKVCQRAPLGLSFYNPLT